jgi:hypothetical protein
MRYIQTGGLGSECRITLLPVPVNCLLPPPVRVAFCAASDMRDTDTVWKDE